MKANPYREEILRRLDLIAEFQKYGGRVPPGAITAPDGWHPVHSIDREDVHPSATLNVGNDPNKRGIYVDHTATGNSALSFFDMMARLPTAPWMMGKEVYQHYGKMTGVFNGDSPKKQTKNKKKFKIVATYDYHDATGNLVFQVCRIEPKSFRQRRPDSAGGWIWDMSGVQLVPYHLPEILAAALVYIVEGEKDVDRLRSLRLVATCNPMGAGKWGKEFSQHLRRKVVVILPDNDPAGKAHAQDVARNLHGVATSVKIVEIPGLLEKGDVSDWIDAGGTLERLRALVDAAPEWDPATAPPEEPEKTTTLIREVGSTYVIANACHRLVKNLEGGVKYIPLCNFTAQITDEITRDDGLRVTREFAITGNVADLPLSPAKVLTKDYDRMAWVRDQWGAAASVTPSRNDAAHLPNAILAHSRALGINRQTIYSHCGWRKINGVWRYLHGGGAIGPGEPVAVDLGENLGNYRLPFPGGIEAAQASLRLLEVGPWEITAPLIACIYLAPFADLCKIDFSLWIYGRTGGLKSTLAALALSHYGNFNRLTLPGSWLSTANSLEKLIFILKDALCVIDDFIPAANSKESHLMSEKAARIIYQAGNRSGRGRLTSDLSARPNHYPRCLIVSTGEMLLPGQRQSATARYLGVELDPEKTPIDKARLTIAQKEAHLYPGAMAAYLADLAPRLEDAQADIKELWEGYRSAFQGAAHLRMPETQAWLAVGFEFFLRFERRMGTISEGQANEMLNRAWKVFEALGEKHSRIIEGQRPTLKFLAVLKELFYQGKIYAEGVTVRGGPYRWEVLGWNGTEPAVNAELVGWADESILYLMPETTMRVVSEAIRRQGDFLALGKNDLLAALAREGFIEPAKGENTQIKWIQGASKRVICLPLVKLAHDEVPEDERK